MCNIYVGLRAHDGQARRFKRRNNMKKSSFGTGVIAILTIIALNRQQQATGAISYTANGQILSCDSSRLLRCQQDILSNLQPSGLNSALSQFSISGPPYSPNNRLVSQTSCRQVRSNLECLLQSTPGCYELDIPAAKNTDYILRAKRYLEENGCNEPDGSWRHSSCYKSSSELRICEDRYETSIANTNPFYSGSYNFTLTCPFYYSFKNCVDFHVRMRCRVQDSDMVNEYLIDKAADHTWRCGQNISSSLLSYSGVQLSQYALNNGLSGSLLSPMNNYGNLNNYDLGQRQIQIPAYVGSLSGIRDQPWERFKNAFDDQGNGRGNVFDRIIDTSDATDCFKRVAPFMRDCDLRLVEDQRRLTTLRDGFEMERNNCCALHRYRSCVAQKVFDRCVDQSPHTAIEVLMAPKQRELQLNCRGVDTMLCSGASSLIYNPFAIAITILASLYSLTSLKISKSAA